MFPFPLNLFLVDAIAIHMQLHHLPGLPLVQPYATNTHAISSNIFFQLLHKGKLSSLKLMLSLFRVFSSRVNSSQIKTFWLNLFKIITTTSKQYNSFGWRNK